MKHLCAHLCAGLLLALASHAACAQSMAILVTPDNFNRAESDLNFGFMVKDGALGKFVHHRELSSIDNPIVPRSAACALTAPRNIATTKAIEP
jgi:hypothetical protein